MPDYAYKYKLRRKPTGYSRVTLRLQTALLERLTAEAQKQGKTLDAWVVKKLEAQ